MNKRKFYTPIFLKKYRISKKIYVRLSKAKSFSLLNIFERFIGEFLAVFIGGWIVLNLTVQKENKETEFTYRNLLICVGSEFMNNFTITNSLIKAFQDNILNPNHTKFPRENFTTDFKTHLLNFYGKTDWEFMQLIDDITKTYNSLGEFNKSLDIMHKLYINALYSEQDKRQYLIEQKSLINGLSITLADFEKIIKTIMKILQRDFNILGPKTAIIFDLESGIKYKYSFYTDSIKVDTMKIESKHY